MIASAHLAVGAVLGLAAQTYLPENYGLIRRVGVGFVAGVASHVLMDSFPHQDYGLDGYRLGRILLLEVSLVFFLVFYPLHANIMSLVIFSAMAGAASPDLLGMASRYVFSWGWLQALDNFFHFYHGKMPVSFTVRASYQLLLALISIIFIKFKSV